MDSNLEFNWPLLLTKDVIYTNYEKVFTKIVRMSGYSSALALFLLQIHNTSVEKTDRDIMHTFKIVFNFVKHLKKYNLCFGRV